MCQVAQEICDRLGVEHDEAGKILGKAEAGGEITASFSKQEWVDCAL